MKKELELKLVKLYPEILQDYGGDMTKTCMAWGMSHGNGWYNIIEELLQTLDKITANKNEKVVADQIKEKFGGLRFYYHVEGYEPNMFDKFRSSFWTFMIRHKWGVAYNKIIDFKQIFFKSIQEKIRDAVHHAESKSYKTCEICSEPGKTRGRAWRTTQCEKCYFKSIKNNPVD